MRKLAFVDHSFHIKSTATKFLIDILRENFETEVFWDESWQTGVELDLEKIKNDGFDYLVLFQMLNYDTELIKRLNFKDVIIIPMYDGCYLYQDWEWKRFESFKFINFSSTLHNKLTDFGIKSHYRQYVPDPDNFSQVNYGKLNGFFWQRTDYINWYKIRKLSEDTRFDRFHLHGAVDPGHTYVSPTPEDIEHYRMTTSVWFDKREDYQLVLNNSNLFFAPRLYEGIGMSFLEAMAKGMCVVAPHFPTMSEYIKHGETGLLYDPFDPKPMDFSDAFRIGRNAREFIFEKRKEWLENIKEIPEYISTPFKFDRRKIKIPRKSFRNIADERMRKIYHRHTPESLKPVIRKVYHILKGSKA